jgi:DNA processing protein
MEDDEKTIYQLLQKQGEMMIDDIAWQAQFSVSKVASILLSMEFKQIVKALPGKRFKLI